VREVAAVVVTAAMGDILAEVVGQKVTIGFGTAAMVQTVHR